MDPCYEADLLQDLPSPTSHSHSVRHHVVPLTFDDYPQSAISTPTFDGASNLKRAATPRPSPVLRNEQHEAMRYMIDADDFSLIGAFSSDAEAGASSLTHGRDDCANEGRRHRDGGALLRKTKAIAAGFARGFRKHVS